LPSAPNDLANNALTKIKWGDLLGKSWTCNKKLLIEPGVNLSDREPAGDRQHEDPIATRKILLSSSVDEQQVPMRDRGRQILIGFKRLEPARRTVAGRLR
jgi:hypothetical protein